MCFPASSNDVGFIYAGLGLHELFEDLAAAGKTDFASEYSKREESAAKELNRIIESYLE